jgi:hypothetical protein
MNGFWFQGLPTLWTREVSLAVDDAIEGVVKFDRDGQASRGACRVNSLNVWVVVRVG